MVEIGGSGPINPRAQQLYESEYKHGAALFQKALIQSSRSGYPAQEEQFMGVMNMALKVLNQSAQELKRQDLIERNAKITNDFNQYKSHPNQSSLNILKKDLEEAKDSVDRKY